jgi:peptidase E
MNKLYLLGGENVYRRSAKRVNERAFQDAEHPLKVLVFAWARLHFERKYRKRKLFIDYLNSLGACTIDFIEYSDSKESIEEKMASAGLIYLTGGLTSVLIERLKEKGVDRLLSSYSGIIIGRSAGALALCRRYISTVRSNSKVRVVDGLGLTDLTLKVHYTPQKDDVLLLFSEWERIYAVPQNSALIFDNGPLEVLGEAYLFENGQKRSLTT